MMCNILSLIQTQLTELQRRYLEGDINPKLHTDCILLEMGTNTLIHSENLLSAFDKHCEFILTVIYYDKVNTTISDVQNFLNEEFKRCLRLVEKGDEYPVADMQISQIIYRLNHDYRTLTGGKLPIFNQFVRENVKRVRQKRTFIN